MSDERTADKDGGSVWRLRVPVAGYRGSITCELGAASMTFAIADPADGFSDSAGATWLLPPSGGSFQFDMCLEHAPTYVMQGSCPAGQPVRAQK